MPEICRNSWTKTWLFISGVTRGALTLVKSTIREGTNMPRQELRENRRTSVHSIWKNKGKSIQDREEEVQYMQYKRVAMRLQT